MRSRWLALLLVAGCAGCSASVTDARSPTPVTPSAATTPPVAASPLLSQPATITASPSCARTLTGRSVTLTVGGVQRTAAVALPAPDGRSAPLIIGFHGYSETVADFDAYTRLRHVGSSMGAVVAEPAGLGSPVGWNVPDSAEVGPSDVLMVRALVELLVERACVDPTRIVLAGISDGADMAVTAACSSGVASAVLLVAASTAPSPRCASVTVLQVHGTQDPIDAYTGRGVDTRRGFGSVKAASAEKAFAAWAALAGCASHTDVTTGDLRRLTGTGCSHPVQLVAVQGGGHTWPGAVPRPQYGGTTASMGTADMVRELLAGMTARP